MSDFWPDELSDPSFVSDEALLEHGRIWCELPELPGITRSMTDADVEAHGDLLYIKGMVDDLTAAKDELQKELKAAGDGAYPVEPLMWWLQFLHRSAESWIPSSLSFSEPWPVDVAGELLVAWRNEAQEKAA